METRIPERKSEIPPEDRAFYVEFGVSSIAAAAIVLLLG